MNNKTAGLQYGVGVNGLEYNLGKIRNYTQRMTTQQWKKILLDNEDYVFYKGHKIPLKGKRLGTGVIEISKDRKVLEKLEKEGSIPTQTDGWADVISKSS